MNEQIYNDIVNNVLPKINQGLTITKDYFDDLFGRYIKLLVFTDIFKSIILLIISFLACKLAIKCIKKVKEDGYETGTEIIMGAVAGIAGLIIFGSLSIAKIEDVAKDIYIPEVRVIEEVNKQIIIDKMHK